VFDFIYAALAARYSFFLFRIVRFLIRSHAVSFDGDAINAIWDRCRDLRCGTARREAEGMLEDGSWTFSATELRGAKVPTGNVTSSLEPSPATPDLSPEPEFD
jgi:hypothetical protein